MGMRILLAWDAQPSAWRGSYIGVTVRRGTRRRTIRYRALAAVRRGRLRLRCETLLEGSDALLEASKGFHPRGQAAHVSLQLPNVAL